MFKDDPINTTQFDGAPCEFCGDDATGSDLLQHRSHAVPTCDTCADLIETCPKCEQSFFGPTGTRIYSTPDLYCPRCAAAHPALHPVFKSILDTFVKGGR
jgi:hypothetical protein